MVWFLLAAAFVATTSYIMYYKSIHIIGPIRAMSTNITYVAWTFLFSIIFLNQEFSVLSILFSLIIVAGSILTVLKKKESNTPESPSADAL
jgi:hypothetical protein